VPQTPSGRTYRGLSAEARDAERRSRLVAAGLEVFGTTGLAGSTIDGLCSRAGVTARNFYDHFDGRESLLRAVYDDVVAAHRAELDAALAAPVEDVRSYLRGAIEAAVRPFARDPRVGRVMHVEVVGVGAALEQHRVATIESYAHLVEQVADDLVAQGLLAPRDRRLTALALVGAMTQLVVSWLAQGPGAAPEPVVDELTRLFTAALP
jgi:AcrR family transcriptional regulator